MYFLHFGQDLDLKKKVAGILALSAYNSDIQSCLHKFEIYEASATFLARVWVAISAGPSHLRPGGWGRGAK